MSRARHNVQIFTNKTPQLAEALARAVSHKTAISTVSRGATIAMSAVTSGATSFAVSIAKVAVSFAKKQLDQAQSLDGER